MIAMKSDRASPWSLLNKPGALFMIGAEMAIVVRGKACPRCKSIQRHRIRRSLWMRLLPGSKYYLCEHCDVKFFSLYSLFSIYWPFGAVA